MRHRSSTKRLVEMLSHHNEAKAMLKVVYPAPGVGGVVRLVCCAGVEPS